MILDLGSFPRKGLIVDRASYAKTLGEGVGVEGGTAKHGRSRGCKTIKEVVEDRETTNLSPVTK